MGESLGFPRSGFWGFMFEVSDLAGLVWSFGFWGFGLWVALGLGFRDLWFGVVWVFADLSFESVYGFRFRMAYLLVFG